MLYAENVAAFLMFRLKQSHKHCRMDRAAICVESRVNRMDMDRKQRLEQLKKENKVVQAQKRVENNILLKECINALASDAELLKKEDADKIYKIFNETIPFLPWGIDWKQLKSVHVVDDVKKLKSVCRSEYFYIIWNAELPIMKSDLFSIIRCIDDISAVEPDTWLLSLNCDEVIELYHEGKITVGMVSEK